MVADFIVDVECDLDVSVLLAMCPISIFFLVMLAAGDGCL